MKSIKSILLTTFGFLAISATTVFWASCEQDSCSILNCQNGGNCTDGLCQCPEGYDGSECQTQLADKYAGTYEGTVRCNYGDILFPIVPDTIYISKKTKPNVINLKIKAGNTSLENFVGKIVNAENNDKSQYVQFEPLVSYDTAGVEVSRIECMADFDGNLIKVYLQTTNAISQEKQSCSFIGQKYTP